MLCVDVRCSLLVVRCALRVVCCLLVCRFIDPLFVCVVGLVCRWLLLAVCRSLCAGCSLLFAGVRCVLLLFWCLLFVVGYCCLLVICLLMLCDVDA